MGATIGTGIQPKSHWGQTEVPVWLWAVLGVVVLAVVGLIYCQVVPQAPHSALAAAVENDGMPVQPAVLTQAEKDAFAAQAKATKDSMDRFLAAGDESWRALDRFWITGCVPAKGIHAVPMKVKETVLRKPANDISFLTEGSCGGLVRIQLGDSRGEWYDVPSGPPQEIHHYRAPLPVSRVRVVVKIARTGQEEDAMIGAIRPGNFATKK